MYEFFIPQGDIFRDEVMKAFRAITPGVSVPDDDGRTISLNHEIVNPRTFVARILAMCSEIEIIGAPVPEKDKASVLAKGLHKLSDLKRDPAFKAIAESDGVLDFATLSTRLHNVLDSKDRNTLSQGSGYTLDTTGGSAHAFYSTPSGSNTTSQRPRNPHSNETCGYCGKRGHVYDVCRKRKFMETQMGTGSRVPNRDPPYSGPTYPATGPTYRPSRTTFSY